MEGLNQSVSIDSGLVANLFGVGGAIRIDFA
jgi:hypothetical protein